MGTRAIAPYTELRERTQGIFINGWALYLQSLGRLAAAARCYELYIELALWRNDWSEASIGNRNLCDVWLLSGRLSRSLALRVEPAGADNAQLGVSSGGALATADEPCDWPNSVMTIESATPPMHAAPMSGRSSVTFSRVWTVSASLSTGNASTRTTYSRHLVGDQASMRPSFYLTLAE